MNNNDVLRRTRYILDLKDNQIVKIFKHVDRAVTDQQVNTWLKRDDEPEFIAMGDEDLIDFLDALIIEKRGKKDGPSVRFKQKLDNNLILMKLKIAFALKAEETLDVMQLAEFKISKHELSALFRKKDHKHYRVCKNQILRKFMKGLQIKHRGKSKAMTNKPAPKAAELSDSPKSFEDKKPEPKTESKLKLKPSKPRYSENKRPSTRTKTVWKVPAKNTDKKD
ncbi:DUF1456 family protein [Marinicella rhabdoformis]|uniref:DUF1456 family protein n=1 Tax=Marinicella rhabdoformis TaxID=2580566 RepID=UPI0012AEC86A